MKNVKSKYSLPSSENYLYFFLWFGKDEKKIKSIFCTIPFDNFVDVVFNWFIIFILINENTI